MQVTKRAHRKQYKSQALVRKSTLSIPNKLASLSNEGEKDFRSSQEKVRSLVKLKRLPVLFSC